MFFLNILLFLSRSFSASFTGDFCVCPTLDPSVLPCFDKNDSNNELNYVSFKLLNNKLTKIIDSTPGLTKMQVIQFLWNFLKILFHSLKNMDRLINLTLFFLEKGENLK